MKVDYSLVVVGASPAGIMHAIAAARNGVEVALLEDQADPDQQSIRDLRDSGIDYLAGHSVWYIDRHREIGVLHAAGKRKLHAERIIIASVAQERPMPFPGWELPGVMTAFEAQARIRSDNAFPDDGVVLSGHGPLLQSLADGFINAGIRIGAMLETTSPDASAMAGKLTSEVPRYRIESLHARGNPSLQSVEFKTDGQLQRIETGLLITHNGFVPDIRLAQAAGCAIQWNQEWGCWQVRVDASGESSQSCIFVEDDVSNILPGVELPLDDDTVVCICESVRLAELKAVIGMGCSGPNQAKAFTRCGMGECQGRLCAVSMEQLFAQKLEKPIEKIGHFRARPPLKPITLGQLADHEEISS